MKKAIGCFVSRQFMRIPLVGSCFTSFLTGEDKEKNRERKGGAERAPGTLILRNGSGSLRCVFSADERGITMPSKAEVESLLERSKTYLTGTLLPFWIERSPDRESGGFLTYFDRDGRSTGETTKTFLMQIRMLYTMASAHRAGYGEGACAELAKMGAAFLLDRYWDKKHGGWFWIADRAGTPIDMSKVGYGQCFGMYAFSEYALATGDERGRHAAEETYGAICQNMADTRHGGYFELMQRDWQPERPGRYGGDRKSMDVHMHMMEALTSFYEMTGHPSHRRRLLEVIDILLVKMLRPESRTGFMQFSLDFEPLPAILFAHSWGRDAEPDDGIARPLDLTSYGHNVEFVWLLLHAADILGQKRDKYREVARKIFDHCLKYGIDYEYGGVYVEGPENAPPVSKEKQFWQQGELLVGMLDAYLLFGDEKYWKVFRNVYDFLFAKFVNMNAGGEWFERLDREGAPVDDALAHAWKISYHSVRSMVQTVQRLKQIGGEK
jgi:mannobiose 2-epimerase